MKHIRVILYDEDTKSIIEHESIPDGEIELNGANETMHLEAYLRVDEILVGSSSYTIVSRRFSIDGAKLIINVRLKD